MLSDTLLEYVWLDSNNKFRSKMRTHFYDEYKKDEIPLWNYDGSSTGQATVNNSEVLLKPVKRYKNPFMDNSDIILCETYNYTENGLLKPTDNNYRHYAEKIFNINKESNIWYGIEQEYFIFDKTTMHPYNLMFLPKQGEHYCGIGNVVGREIALKHYKYCLNAGVKICGINAEVAPSQWEYQIGICQGIDAADDLLMARYIYDRIGELYNVAIIYDPKPLSLDYNGSGCHINFSTKNMRESYNHITESVNKLKNKHQSHLLLYGDNSKRLTGTHETSSKDLFSYGVGTRNTSIRIPNDVFKKQKGYIEDRRPASDIDPYLATSIIYETVVLNYMTYTNIKHTELNKLLEYREIN